MKYSQVFPKTLREAPKDAMTTNHKLLVRAGFIDQLMAGSWTLLPLGWKVVQNISQIIREELNTIGAQEMLMPLLHPKEIWNQTGRWESADEVMYKLKDTRDKEFALSFTHEEIVMHLMTKFIQSYKDLPLSVYHFSTKFRNELRSQGGILRGREFLMKDAYTMHTSEEDLMMWYEKYKQAYLKIFERIGLHVYVTEASGGVFTNKHTHEFQVAAEAGEDTIYIKPGTHEGYNKEVFEGNEKDYEVIRSIEVGNIFPLGTMYAEKMGGLFTDADGTKKPIWFGSYGIGTTRLMGTLVEVFHDDRGIIWPEAVAPFRVQLVDIRASERAKVVYETLVDRGVSVLWDDTDRSAGEKLADADLLGMPHRIVVSAKNGEDVEYKKRLSEQVERLSLDQLLTKLS